MRCVSVLSSAIIVTLVLVAGTVSAAQEGTPAASAATLPAPLPGWVEAWERADVDGIVAAYADDVVFEDVAFGVVIKGKEALRTYLKEQFAASPDLSVETTSAVIAGDWAVTEWTLTGTYSGQIPGLPPGVGQVISFRGVSVLELEGDKIRADREYYDAYAYLVAAGALAAPDVPGTPAP